MRNMLGNNYIHIDYTPNQLNQLRWAGMMEEVEVDASDYPFSLHLLNAVTTNPKIQTLSFEAENKPRREIIDAFVHILDRHPMFPNLAFHGEYPCDLGDGSVRDNSDYAALVVAIAECQSLKRISVGRFLSFELEEAIMEALKRRSILTELMVFDSRIMMQNPAGFGNLLATSICLSSLDLFDCNVGDGGMHIKDGLRMNQTLKRLYLRSTERRFSATTYKCIFEGLDGNQSLETLQCWETLDSSAALLLNKVVYNHVKLACLSVSVAPDCVNHLCQAVSHSQFMRHFYIDPHSHSSAISRMLQQTKSLQSLHLENCKGMDMEQLAVGLKACETLTSLSLEMWGYDVRGTRALLEAVLVNHNITKISPLPERKVLERLEDVQNREVLQLLMMELNFYLLFNQQGRALLRTDVPSNVWPYALKMAGNSTLPDALYFFIRETPELMMHHSVA